MNLFFLSDATKMGDLSNDLETIQHVASSSDVTASFAKMMASFFLVIVLLIATYLLIKYAVKYRLEKGVGTKQIYILEKKMISPKTMLYLVEVENKKVLLAESQLEIKKLESFLIDPNECEEKPSAEYPQA